MNWSAERLRKYLPNFSETKLWNKLSGFAQKAGVKTIYAVLLCYYVLKSPNVSKEDKAIIFYSPYRSDTRWHSSGRLH